MDDRLLVEALRARAPDAPAAVYDAYGEGLYTYCRSRLGDADAARTALRDALVVAETHVWRLREAGRFRAWLFALAAGECARAESGGAPAAGEDGDDDGEPGPRRAARRAVAALSAEARDLLGLRHEHGLDPADAARVAGVPDGDAALDRAHRELEAALTAEILADVPCPDRPADADRPARLLQHVRDCDVCAPRAPRTVSAAKVFAELPRPPIPRALRPETIACFRDPELVGRRLFVAARVTDFGADGFPALPGRPARRGGGRRGLVFTAGAAALVLAGALSLALWHGANGSEPAAGRGGAAEGATADAPSARPGARVTARPTRPAAGQPTATVPVSGSYSFGASASLPPPDRSTGGRPRPRRPSHPQPAPTTPGTRTGGGTPDGPPAGGASTPPQTDEPTTPASPPSTDSEPAPSGS
ncbi:RNA polymerase sigma factor [Actinomadura atramentaria]|uniref:RNA polymerase sigma factor n=1 Tax=Actinomadura atramentaria TaxID=1990 RepID=UPI00037DD64A|nr:hypothetical protein [Actinomadura atramentaria]